MSKKIILIYIIIFFSLSIFLNVLIYQDQQEKIDYKELKNLDHRQLIELQEMFYEESNFVQSINLVADIKVRDDVYSIVVPHHLLASEYISGLMKMAKGREIKKVVIIGPNHDDIGTQAISTANLRWNTPLGIVKTDSKLVDKFKNDLNIQDNSSAFINEHSIGALNPFVKYYFPEAEILPIIISSYVYQEEVEQLAYWLDNNLSADTLLIISTDFSHYLLKDEAEKNDRITKNFILQDSIDELLDLDNAYLDSPGSLVTALI
ncbi:AmmeMemoRadiSam system protein B, partial [bacterium]|nr:AmmeMemoRadiSam system protein B [bacterium]